VRLPIRMGAMIVLACTLASPMALAQDQDRLLPSIDEPPQETVDDSSYDAFDADTDSDDDYGPQTDLEALDRAHAAYLKKGDLQLERPEFDAPEIDAPEIELKPRKPPPRWLQAFFDFIGNLGPLFKFIFWVAVAVAAAGILYFLFGEAIRVRFSRNGKGKVDNADDVLVDLRPDATVARSLLDQADALARAGKFAEAVHLLLFRSIDDIQQRLEGGVPRSLTAREIGGLRHLPERAKRGLGPIIQIVEHSFFGSREVDETGWKTARDSYEHFAFGEGWA
jgi:hypothetical protein